MYDETIQRSARRSGITPIKFNHFLQDELIACINEPTSNPPSVILTGTAGDGKTHLCRQAWKELGGSDKEWEADSPYLIIQKGNRKVHIIRDLSAWAPQQGYEWSQDKGQLLNRMCQSFFEPIGNESFLVAANDGQLVESLRRLSPTHFVEKANRVVEDFLVENRKEQHGINLKFFNLSRTSSANLFDLSIDSFLSHPGWDDLKEGSPHETELFGSKCPIRHNYELLQSPCVRSRLRALLELCDHNDLHVPIRQILLLLANAVLGHPDVKSHLMVPADVPKVIMAGTVSKASLYNNIFGGNLSEIRRQSITIFDYFERFQIGFETSNRVNNIIIFGQDDPQLGTYFHNFIADDKFYGADDRFYAAKKEYIESSDTNDDKSQEFLQMLIAQRRGLFFKIPKDMESDLKLWELTVFKFAGQYLQSVVEVLKNKIPVKRPILSQLIKGLNRVFTGMFINSDRELFLASSGNYSQSKVSRILVERVSVEPSKGEKIILEHDPTSDRVYLTVFFSPDIFAKFHLTLIRFEYLSRISLEGALPASFSKECYEDLLAFKSQLIAAYMKRQQKETSGPTSTIGLNILALTEQGMPNPRFVEII
jgi:hypothetical protein